MSWYKSGGAASGFSFEGKVTHLLENLNFNTRVPNMIFACSKPTHQKNPHEIDLWLDFFDSCGQQIPRYAGENMIVSCKKTLKDCDAVLDQKTLLLESIECYKSYSGFDSTGLIITSSSLPNCSPDLNDDVFFWDLRRSTFYAWKSHYANNEKMKFNPGENPLDRGNSFVFMVDDPQKIGLNFAECHVFFDQIVMLDGRTTERILNQILAIINSRQWFVSGNVIVKIHAINGYVEQILTRKKVIERRVSTPDIKFEIQNIFDYSIVSWEPLVFP